MAQSLLRIGSAHNKQEPPDVLQKFRIFELKLWFIFLYEHRKQDQCKIFSLYIIFSHIYSETCTIMYIQEFPTVPEHLSAYKSVTNTTRLRRFRNIGLLLKNIVMQSKSNNITLNKHILLVKDLKAKLHKEGQLI